MAPLKFEDKIREKLEQRTIKPSNGSWEKLEEQLDDPYSDKKTKKYGWLAIAASVAGFLIITTIFVQENKKTSDIEFVNTTTDKELIKENQFINPSEITQEESKSDIYKNQKDKKEEIVSTRMVESNKNNQFRNENTEETRSKTSNNKEGVITKKAFKENVKQAVAVKIDVIKNDASTENESLTIAAEIIDDKVVGVFAKVKELKENKKIVTNEEVDALLRKAQLEITTDQILKSKTVNASALLLDIESELDESFKNRVFEALKTGFEKLKTTVAERDN